MKISQLIPDTKNTIAVFEVSETDFIEEPVLCWALLDSTPDVQEVIGLVKESSNYPALIRVDTHELKFIGYITGKANA